MYIYLSLHLYTWKCLLIIGFPGGSDGKESACSVKNLPTVQETCVQTWVGKIPWRRKWQPIQVFLPGEFHGQWSLTGYSSYGCKEFDMTERLSLTPFFSLSPCLEGKFPVALVKTFKFLLIFSLEISLSCILSPSDRTCIFTRYLGRIIFF